MGKDTRLAELTQAKIGQYCVSSILLPHHLQKILYRLFHQEYGGIALDHRWILLTRGWPGWRAWTSWRTGRALCCIG